MRLFVALRIPPAEGERIREGAALLRKADFPIRWTDPEQYHLTLKFLGDVPDEKVDAIGEVVSGIAEGTPPVTLRLGGIGAFPTIRRPRVLWMGVEATPVLRCLKQDLEWALGELGFERDARAFHPHVTLGRSKTEDGGGAFRGLDELAAGLAYSARVEVPTLDLVQSRLTSSGPRYTVLRADGFDAAAGEE